MSAIPFFLAESITFQFNLNAAIALAAGILILIYPKMLNLIVAIYLIFVGVTGMVNF